MGTGHKQGRRGSAIPAQSNPRTPATAHRARRGAGEGGVAIQPPVTEGVSNSTLTTPHYQLLPPQTPQSLNPPKKNLKTPKPKTPSLTHTTTHSWGLERSGLPELRALRDSLLPEWRPPSLELNRSNNNLGVVYFAVCLTLGIVIPALRRSRIL